jgi:hypothetical protein
MKSAFLELWKENSQVPEEGLTDEEGFFGFNVKQVGSLHLVANKSGFITTTKKINITSGFLDAKDQYGSYTVTVPMLRDLDPSS